MKSTRKAGIIGVSAVMLLSGALPAAAEAVTSGAAAEPALSNVAVPISAKDAVKPSEIPTDTKIKKDEAVELARKYAKVPEDYTLENVSFYSASGKEPYSGASSNWNINFSKRKDDRYYGNISVAIHADTGKLIHFYRNVNDPDMKPSYPPKTSLKDAKQVAEAYLSELYPEEFKSARYNTSFEDNFRTPLNGDVRYSLRYDRTVNGIPFPQNGLNVTVDGKGEVVEFSYSWEQDAKFADASGVIGMEKALEVWKKESQVVASYFRPWNYKKELPLVTAYRLNATALDALTGKAWPESAKPSGEEKPLTVKPLGAAPQAGAMLTQEQAVAAVTSTFKLPEGAVLQHASYNEYSPYPGAGTPEGTWNINWNVPEEKAEGQDKAKILPYQMYIYATVNAETGEVRNFNTNSYFGPYGQTEIKDEKVTYEAGMTQAAELVKKLVPHMTHQLVPVHMDPDVYPVEMRNTMPTHSYSFKRVIDGMEAGGEMVSVNIDRKTGEVVNYSNNLTSLAYPETKPAMIDPDQAKEMWLSQYNLELQYVMPKGSGYYPYYGGIPYEKYNLMVAAGEIPGAVPGEAPAEKPAYVPVYIPVMKNNNMYNVYLDAATGEWRNSENGNLAVIGKVRATDTEGHWAGRELDLMVEYNALALEDGQVSPDKIATRGEMIKMLLTAMNGGHFYAYYDTARAASFADVKNGSALFAYVENAVDRNLIDRNPSGNFNPDEPMTREEMAELIVRALGYNELAKKKDLFRLDIADADSVKFQGHVALVLGLGIMTASDEDLFRPQEEVTRAQAAVAFFRYLEQRSSLMSQPMYY